MEVRDSLSLRMDEDGVVHLDDADDPYGDAVRLGGVLSVWTEDRCPKALLDDLEDLRREWAGELAGSGEGRRELRRLYREGSLR